MQEQLSKLDGSISQWAFGQQCWAREKEHVQEQLPRLDGPVCLSSEVLGQRQHLQKQLPQLDGLVGLRSALLGQR